MDALDSVENEVDNICAKLQIVRSQFGQSVDDLIAFFGYLKKNLDESIETDEDYELTPIEVARLSDATNQARYALNLTTTSHRALHLPVSKVGKMIDRHFDHDVGSLTSPKIFSSGEYAGDALNLLLCEHLYREGMGDVGDALCSESGIQVDEKFKVPLAEQLNIVQSLKEHNLEPVLAWAIKNDKVLNEIGSELKFLLHRQSFLRIVKQGPGYQGEAVLFARKHLSLFATERTKEVQQLMGVLLYTPRNLEESPYAYLFAQLLWDNIFDTFIKDSCSILDLPIESQLSVCFSVGCTAVRTMLNIRRILDIRRVSGFCRGSKEPDVVKKIETPLAKEYQYHSVFACPILRQRVSESNPPMRLQCGHVICQDAVMKLASSNNLKCPYCPGAQNISKIRRIIFSNP